jgi:hypothetical protein
MIYQVFFYTLYLAFQNHLQEPAAPDFKFASTSSFNKNYGTPALLVLLLVS